MSHAYRLRSKSLLMLHWFRIAFICSRRGPTCWFMACELCVPLLLLGAPGDWQCTSLKLSSLFCRSYGTVSPSPGTNCRILHLVKIVCLQVWSGLLSPPPTPLQLPYDRILLFSASLGTVWCTSSSSKIKCLHSTEQLTQGRSFSVFFLYVSLLPKVDGTNRLTDERICSASVLPIGLSCFCSTAAKWAEWHAYMPLLPITLAWLRVTLPPSIWTCCCMNPVQTSFRLKNFSAG